MQDGVSSGSKRREVPFRQALAVRLRLRLHSSLALGPRSKLTQSIPSAQAGAAAGLSVDLLFFPLDTIKTRLQATQGFWAAGGFRGVYRGVGSVGVGGAPGGEQGRRVTPAGDLWADQGGPAGLPQPRPSSRRTSSSSAAYPPCRIALQPTRLSRT